MRFVAVCTWLCAFPGLCLVAEEVFVPDPMTTVYEGQDYSGRNDPGCAIGLVGVRNGAFSGQVVVFSKGSPPEFVGKRRQQGASGSGLGVRGAPVSPSPSPSASRL
jgi:hypothetical protein